MIPFIFIGSYKIGGLLLQNPSNLTIDKIKTILAAKEGLWASVKVLFENVWQYAIGAFALGTLAALVFGVLSYEVLAITRVRH